jgi:hypothetical protein
MAAMRFRGGAGSMTPLGHQRPKSHGARVTASVGTGHLFASETRQTGLTTTAAISTRFAPVTLQRQPALRASAPVEARAALLGAARAGRAAVQHGEARDNLFRRLCSYGVASRTVVGRVETRGRTAAVDMRALALHPGETVVREG